jgi:hypothetical protein
MEKIKEIDKNWKDGMAKQITFIVTKDCQLALSGKTTRKECRSMWRKKL